jgi:DNA-binding NarL/FixJ family response regulator
MMPINISIVEKNCATFAKLKPWLSTDSGVDCSKVYLTGEEAVTDIPVRQPEIVLIDANLSPMTSSECVTRIKSRLPSLPIAILPSDDDAELALESLCVGADACVPKNLSPVDMIKTVEQSRRGEISLPVPIVRHLIRYIYRGRFGQDMEFLVEKFSRREMEVLDLLAQGCSNEQIGQYLECSPFIIKSDQRNILQKLHANTRIQALTRFLRTEPPRTKEKFFKLNLFTN